MANRRFVSFPFCDLYKIKKQVLSWSARFDTCCFLDNHLYHSAENSFESLVAVGEQARLSAQSGNAFEQLRHFSSKQRDWLFGHFSFDLKAETENVPSHLPDDIAFPDLFFFVPEIVLLITDTELQIGLCGDHHDQIFEAISAERPLVVKALTDQPVIESRISKAAYLLLIEKLRQHILRGDCYEINFCQEFFARNIRLNPLDLYEALGAVSPSPFSAFYKTDGKYLLCASPERYLKKTGNSIRSQPIKGTAARNLTDAGKDAELKTALATSEKDRAENVMIVDLVRNDLSKICEPDSVRVEELFGIYSFPQVHQMISTIVGKPRADLHWSQLIAGSFPMGSMTGAPKKRVLELIENYEKTKRGLFSGALGYVKPDQDFDFNVVIRSILYNAPNRHLSYFAGSGITVNSDPEKEYGECLMKVAAFENVIKNPSVTAKP